MASSDLPAGPRAHDRPGCRLRAGGRRPAGRRRGGLGWVAYEDDPQQGKDRPVLLLARDGDDWLGLMLSSQDHDRDAADEASYGRHWMDVGTGGWDREGRPSEVRLDRLIRLAPGAIRREGAALDRDVFDAVVGEARTFHDFG